MARVSTNKHESMYCIVWFGVRARRDGFVRRRAHCHPTQLALLYSRDLREDQAKFVLVSCAAGSHNLGQQLGRERTFHAAHDACIAWIGGGGGGVCVCV